MASQARVFVVVAFAATWGIGGLGLLLGWLFPDSRPFSTSSPLYYLAAYSVSVTGLALTAWYGGRDGLPRLGGRLIPWRSSPAWYVIVVAGYGAITIAAVFA